MGKLDVAAEELGIAFTTFVRDAEPALRQALVASYGLDLGQECTAEALAFGWKEWTRVSQMDNPVGYLFRVGQSSARQLARRPPLLPAVDVERWPWVEPALPQALDALSVRQRTVVVLVHCFGWTHAEVADLLEISRSSVQEHGIRGLRRLRKAMGVNTDDGSG
jgi:DNA-directed RNA polymerase specialized sigma24 family protein